MKFSIILQVRVASCTFSPTCDFCLCMHPKDFWTISLFACTCGSCHVFLSPGETSGYGELLDMGTSLGHQEDEVVPFCPCGIWWISRWFLVRLSGIWEVLRFQTFVEWWSSRIDLVPFFVKCLNKNYIFFKFENIYYYVKTKN